MKLTTSLSALSLALILPATQVAAEDWTGFYAGGTIGYSWGDVDAGDNLVALGKLARVRSDGFNMLDPSGEDISAFAGYRMQSGAMVYGGEVDLRFGGLSDSTGSGFVDATVEAENTVGLRGNVGYDLNDMLIYGAFGVVSTDFGDFTQDVTQDRFTGYSIGIGVERMVTETLSIRGELSYERYNFDVELNTGKISQNAHIGAARLSIGANFRF